MELSRAEERLRLRLQLAKSKEYLDITDVILLSGLSSSTIRRRISEGVLKAYQSVPNGKLLFAKDSIDKFIRGGGE